MTDGLSLGVPWSASPPQDPRRNSDQLPQCRMSLSRKVCSLHGSGEDTNDRTRRKRRASLTIEPASSVSNQWFNLFTERLLHRKQRPPSPRQGPQPRVAGDLLEHTIAPHARMLEPDSPETTFSHAQSLSHRYKTLEGSGAHGNFAVPRTSRDIDGKHAHRPHRHLNDNLRADTRDLREQDRPRKRGKYEHEAQKEHSVIEYPNAIATFDKHSRGWYWNGCTEQFPSNHVHHIGMPLESPLPLPRMAYGTGVLPSEDPGVHQNRSCSVAHQVTPSPTFNFHTMGSLADHATSGNHSRDGNREHLGDWGLAQGSLDAFDLGLLESIQSGEQRQRPDQPPSPHDRMLGIEARNLLGEAGQARSLRPRTPADLTSSLHVQTLSPRPDKLVDSQLRLKRPTLERLKDKAFNPYKKPHLFA